MQNLGAQFKFNFRELRRERDMSQAQFAEFLGLSRPTVGFYESGERSPDADTIKKICKKCAVSADWLLGLGGVKGDNASEVAIGKLTGLSPKTVRLLYSQKKKTDAAETVPQRFAYLSVADFINYAIEYFPNRFNLACKSVVEAIACTGFIRPELEVRLNEFLDDAEKNGILDFIRGHGADIITAELKKEMCIDVSVREFRTLIENYTEIRGSELLDILKSIREKEGRLNNAVSEKENE